MLIFVLGRHLGFSNCEGLGQGDILLGSRGKVEKMGKGGGAGKEKIRLPAGFVGLQNPYTRWTGALIGAVGCKLIDACQSKVVFLPAVMGGEREKLGDALKTIYLFRYLRGTLVVLKILGSFFEPCESFSFPDGSCGNFEDTEKTYFH